MVNIDTVYQRVLALANKEQRGYITPQEFNLYANQAQMDIFEQYFYDLNQFKRVPGNDSEYHDMVDLIEEKIYPFKKHTTVGSEQVLTDLTGFYRLGSVYEIGTSTATDPYGSSKTVEEINLDDLIKTQNSPLTRATESRPVYYINENTMYFVPATGTFQLFYIRKP